ncbi:MAG: sigma 54-interacting transcriptional regulator [Labilithrix sp.]|nr:sigma 54-interacting transcriptional regulator [Labilithrix sp.]
MVLAPGGVQHRTLPDRGSLVVGRSDECDVTVDDASVSRRHARIDVAGERITIEDLGSANGTRLRRRKSAVETAEVTEVRLERGAAAELALDEPVLLGSVTVLVRAEPEDVEPAPASAHVDGVVIAAPETKRVFDLAERIAKGPLNVLLTGETGVGKEVVAAFIHRRSPRAHGPLVEVNCAALTETLAESELFGHVKGAFTGAAAAKEGFFEAADGGTLFLDEIGELAPALQAKLLRVLETKKVLRVGATTPVAVDVRVIAATHRDLVSEVKRGAFRQDLYFRLNGMTVVVPPLRERRGDVRELAQLFAARTARIMGLGEPSLEPAAVARLEAHGWPGNVRELRNVVDRAVTLAGGDALGVEHLVFDESALDAGDKGPVAEGGGNLRTDLAAEEKRRILAALASCDNNQTRAAELLSMPRRTLVARLQEYGLTKPRRKPEG